MTDPAAPTLSADALMVLKVFTPMLTRSSGRRLLRDIVTASTECIRNGEFKKAQFALLLSDILKPQIDAIPVQARKPQQPKTKAKAKR